MLISRVWLESLLTPAPGEPLGDAAFGEAITSLGLEVDGMKRVGQGLETIIVGRIDAVQPHPEADRLHCVKLFDGKRVIDVVCGASNLPPPGGKVAFAPVGTTLPGGLAIGARAIRGVASEGMICAEDELEIGPDDSGIIVLPSEWEPGARLADLVPGVIDTIYELGITPNRPDALGHVGVARDLAIKLGRKLALGELARPTPPTDDRLVTLQAPDRCGRYIGLAFEGAKVGPSPLWLRVRLHRLGLRSINNVVDITNLVLMEWGQPLHAFDRGRLAQGRVVVRLAAPGEPFETLDDRSLELGSDDLVIADAERPQALAGVMGGSTSGVTDQTSTLLLEAAWFAPRSIRRTARAHQIASDSSYRFERGVDHGLGLDRAVARASALLQELAGASLIAGAEARGEVPAVPTIALRPARCTLVLGMEVPAPDALAVLRGLEIEVDDRDPARFVCRPPTHRPDLQREVDLIEELVRHHGLDRLPPIPALPSTAAPLELPAERIEAARRARFEDEMGDALRSVGLHEHVSLAFASVEQLEPFADEVPLAAAVEIANPLRVQTSHLRTHMLPGLLEALRLNVARHGRPVRLFELGRVYAWGDRKDLGGPTAEIDRHLPLEPKRAAILLSAGAPTDAAYQSGETPIDGRSLAGLLLSVLGKVGLRARLGPPRSKPVTHLHPGVQATVIVESDHVPQGREVGTFGEVHPELMRRFDLPDDARAFYAELRLDELPIPATLQARPVPRHPATSRDLSLDIPVALPAAVVVEALRLAETEVALNGADPPRLAMGDRGSLPIEVLEDYRGQGIEPGRRALLLRLHYRARDRSVTDAEVQRRHAEVVAAACAALQQQWGPIKPR